MEFKLSTAIKEMRSFLGFRTFFAKFKTNYADKILSLHKTFKVKENSKFVMTKKHRKEMPAYVKKYEMHYCYDFYITIFFLKIVIYIFWLDVVIGGL